MMEILDHESAVPRNRSDWARKRRLASQLVGIQEWINHKRRKVEDLQGDLARLEAQRAAVVKEMEGLP